MRILLIAILILLTSCSTRLMLIIESEDATKGTVKVEKEQLDDQAITVKPTLPPAVTN